MIPILPKFIHYIHNNPIHHGFVKSIIDWPYSSYHSHLSTKPTQLQREFVLDWFGGKLQFEKHHMQPINFTLIGDME